MKVWHITKSLAGGAGQYALRLSGALQAEGVDSVVLAVDGDSQNGSAKLIRSDGRLRHFASRVQRSLIRRISLGPYHSMRGFERYNVPADLFKPDIVHLHGLTGWIGMSGLRQLIPPRAEVFQTTHSPFDYSGGCVLLAGASCEQFKTGCHECPILKASCKWIAHSELNMKCEWAQRNNIHPIANSTWMAKQVEESLVYAQCGEVPIIRPIVSDVYLETGPSGLRQELGIDNERFVICLGANAVTDRGKGIRELVERLARHPDLVNQSTFVLFGDGNFPVPEGMDLHFLGKIHDPARLAGVFRSSDIFVSPSEMETFGMTLVEAQAVGIPVVAFETGGIGDAMFPGHRDRLVPLNNWEALIETIGKVLKRPVGSGDLDSAKNWVLEGFTGKPVALQQIRIYGKYSN